MMTEMVETVADIGCLAEDIELAAVALSTDLIVVRKTVGKEKLAVREVDRAAVAVAYHQIVAGVALVFALVTT